MPTYTTNPIKITDPNFSVATAIFSDLAFLGTQTVSSSKKAQLIPFTLLGLATTTTVLQKALNLSDLLDPIAARGNLGAKNLWYVSGTSAPLGTLGIVNDFAFNDNGVLYEKTAAAVWTSRIDFVTQAELTAANYLTATAANLLYAPIGENAGPGLRYTYNTSTTFPATTGQILLSAATFAATTSISVHTSDRNSRDFASVLDLGGNGSRLHLTFDGAEETYAWFNVTAIATSGSTRTYTVTYIQSNGTPSNGEMLLQVVTVGGGGGGGGIRLERTFSNTTTGNPTSGTLRLASSNPQTTPATVKINDTRNVNSFLTDQGNLLDKIKIGNIIQITNIASGVYHVYQVTAIATVVVATTTSYNFTCDWLFGTAGVSSFPNNAEVAFTWLPDNSTASTTSAATGIKYTYNPTAGAGRISAVALEAATSLTISNTDATDPTPKDAANVLARLKNGAIIQVAKDASNWIRYNVTADYASGVVTVTVDQSSGAIASNDTVYLSIVSDAPVPGPEGDPGPPGTVTATQALGLTPLTTDPTASATEILLYAKTDNKIYRRLRSGDGGGIQEVGAGAGGRPTLTQNTTYYISSSGADTNNGLSSATPFLTFSKALSVINALDTLGNFDVDLNVLTDIAVPESDLKKLKPLLGDNRLRIKADSGIKKITCTPTITEGWLMADGANVIFKDLNFETLNPTAYPVLLQARFGATVTFENCTFTKTGGVATQGAIIISESGSTVIVSGTLTLVGQCERWLSAGDFGRLTFTGATITGGTCSILCYGENLSFFRADSCTVTNVTATTRVLLSDSIMSAVGSTYFHTSQTLQGNSRVRTS